MIHFNPPFKFKLLPVKSVTGGGGDLRAGRNFPSGCVYLFAVFVLQGMAARQRLPASSQAGSATDVLEH